MRITDQAGRPFYELYRMVQAGVATWAIEQHDKKALPDEEIDILIIDLGYCIDQITLDNHPYPYRKRKTP